MKARRVLSFAVTSVTALLITLVGGVFPPPPALAGPFDRSLGDPYYVDISNAGQKAILEGGKWAAGAAIRVASSGTRCLITGGLIAVIVPFVESATICPNNGVRRLQVQNYLAPPAPGGYQSEVMYAIKSSKCISG